MLDVSSHTEGIEDFTGREWVFAEINRWLADPDAPRFFIITGEPGIGKTAIARRLVGFSRGAAVPPKDCTHIGEGWLSATHFCNTRYGGMITPEDFARSLSGELASRYPVFAEALMSDPQVIVDQRAEEVYGRMVAVWIDKYYVDNPEAIFNKLVRFPLQALRTTNVSAHLVIILIDGLDESLSYSGRVNIVSLLSTTWDLPRQVRFVLTCRQDSRILDHFDQVHGPHLLLNADRRENLGDLQRYLDHQLRSSEPLRNALSKGNVNAGYFVEKVLKVSQGNFLYLVWLLRSIIEGRQDPNELDSLPPGLDGVYREFLITRTVGQDPSRWRTLYRPALAALVAAREALSSEQLHRFSGLPRQDLRDVLEDVEQFLDPIAAMNGRYRLYHQSVADFLVDYDRARRFWIDPQPVHQQISNWYLEGADGNRYGCDRYALHHLVHHLCEAGLFDEIDRLIFSRPWFNARRMDDFSRSGVVGDLDLHFNTIVRRKHLAWAQLPANALMKATLTVTADHFPIEIYEVLVYEGRLQEAVRRAYALSDDAKRHKVLRCVADTARRLGDGQDAGMILDDLPEADEHDVENDPLDQWLIALVDRIGVENALTTLLRSRPGIDPDYARASDQALEVARAALSLGRKGEARTVLLKCLDWMEETQLSTQQQQRLPAVAKLLLAAGEERDFIRLVSMAQKIDIDLRQLYALSEIALLFARSSQTQMATKALTIALEVLDQVERRATLQFAYAKLALSMAILEDGRSEEFLNEAIRLAERSIQPLWYWDEMQARVALAQSLAYVGLCDEALTAVSGYEHEAIDADGLVIELVKHGYETEAWALLDRLHPLARQRPLAALAHYGQLPASWYEELTAQLGHRLEDEGQLRSRLELLSLFIEVERSVRTGKEVGYLQQMLDELKHSTEKVTSTEIEIVLQNAEDLADVTVLDGLIPFASQLPEDRQFTRSNTVTRLVLALAGLGATDRAWELACSVDDLTKQIEAYVRVIQKMKETDGARRERFAEALSLIGSLENAGWVPNFWGELGVLAQKLELYQEKTLCTEKAVAGTKTGQAGYSYGFNILNCGYVGRALNEVGDHPRAVEMVRCGLKSLQHQSYDQVSALRHLVRVASVIGGSELWDEMLTTARSVNDPARKVEAMLGVTHAIAREGGTIRARELLGEVLECLLAVPVDAELTLEFGKTVAEFWASERELLSDLVIRAMEHARSKDRQTAIMWTAGVLPIFVLMSLELGREAWDKFVQADSMLTDNR